MALIQACIPSSCGIFVYKDDTSMLTKIASSGIGRVVINSMNAPESLMWDGSFVTRGFNHPSRKFEIFSVTAFNHGSDANWIFMYLFQEINLIP